MATSLCSLSFPVPYIGHRLLSVYQADVRRLETEMNAGVRKCRSLVKPPPSTIRLLQMRGAFLVFLLLLAIDVGVLVLELCFEFAWTRAVIRLIPDAMKPYVFA